MFIYILLSISNQFFITLIMLYR